MKLQALQRIIHGGHVASFAEARIETLQVILPPPVERHVASFAEARIETINDARELAGAAGRLLRGGAD